MLVSTDVKALRAVKGDLVALVMPADKIDELHNLIGKTRTLINSLPDKNIVLRVDFEAQILSQNGDKYCTELKVGSRRTRIDAIKVCDDESTAPAILFWPMWNGPEVVFESLGLIEIELFVHNWNIRSAKD